MILSVSRRTDIPAFYSEWFFNRIKEGYVYVRSPYDKNAVSKVSLNPKLIDCIIFWTKNPSENFIKNLHKISNYNYYFQFSLNPYDKTLEQNISQKKKIIAKFKKVSELLGKEKIIWRYDPILLSDSYTIEYHIEYFDKLATILSPFTEKCIISFIDLYKKCERNLKGTTVRELDNNEIILLAKKLKEIASKFNLKLESCAEEYDLDLANIKHGKCIDNILIERITGKILKAKKDKNQREVCGCIESIDIGEYNTCLHNCLYCYANFSKEKVVENFTKHDSESPLLIGHIKSTDIIKERKMSSLLEKSLFD